jgi:hypothetical protein
VFTCGVNFPWCCRYYSGFGKFELPFKLRNSCNDTVYCAYFINDISISRLFLEDKKDRQRRTVQSFMTCLHQINVAINFHKMPRIIAVQLKCIFYTNLNLKKCQRLYLSQSVVGLR